MKTYGVDLHLKQAFNEKVVGTRFHIGDESIKGSDVDRSFSAARLQKQIQENYEYHNRYHNRDRKEYQKSKFNHVKTN